VLVSQTVIPSRRSLGGFFPYAFTEQGVAMLSSVLRSERAIMVNIAIMRTFVRLRHTLPPTNYSSRGLLSSRKNVTGSSRWCSMF